MDLVVFLEELRSAYLVQYESTYQQQSPLYDQLTPEVAFEISDGVYKNLYVIDFIARNGSDMSAIEVGTSETAYLTGDLWSFEGLQIEVGYVSWDALQVDIGIPPEELIGFDIWFDKWIDLERVLPAPDEQYGHS